MAKEAEFAGYDKTKKSNKTRAYVVSGSSLGFPLFLILLGAVWLIERLYQIDLPLVAILLIGWGLWMIANRYILK
jgi:hypothetical protein|tara:strand:+ start:135 stop:359 length:225 start_codon:yes stop_codon:yes gene_type:complete